MAKHSDLKAAEGHFSAEVTRDSGLLGIDAAKGSQLIAKNTPFSKIAAGDVAVFVYKGGKEVGIYGRVVSVKGGEISLDIGNARPVELSEEKVEKAGKLDGILTPVELIRETPTPRPRSASTKGRTPETPRKPRELGGNGFARAIWPTPAFAC